MKPLKPITLLLTFLFVLLIALPSNADGPLDCPCLLFEDSPILRCPGATAQSDLNGDHGYCDVKVKQDANNGGNCQCYGCGSCWDHMYSEELKKQASQAH
jgi:hypothetical protein